MQVRHRLNIGTTNTDKIREIAAILAPLNWALNPLLPMDVSETADTFEGNAILKGVAYAAASGGMTLSEDSGIEIDALNGLPGPWSARFSDCDFLLDKGKIKAIVHPHNARPREEMDRLNNEKVLQMLGNAPNRAARFVVVLVVVNPTGEVLFQTRSEMPGTINTEMRGTHGFGYDPIFIGEKTYGSTLAEIDSARKNLRSHRRNVLDAFYWWAKEYTP